MRASRREFLAAAAGLAATQFALRKASAQDGGKRGGTLTVGTVNMRHLNPAIQSGNATGVPGTQIFAGLVVFDSHFNAKPYLARAWDIAEDGLTYKFHLVDGAVFHDGRPVTAEDVVFSIETVRAHHPLLSVTFGTVLDTVGALDSTTVQLRLKEPYPALLSALAPALTPVLPRHVYDNGPIQTNPANSKPVGSGPFKFVDWKVGEYLVLERHDKFFRPDRPYLDRLNFKIVEDPTTKALLMERGALDYLPFSFLRFVDVVRLQKNPNLKVTTQGYEALGPINYLNINLRDAPLNDIRVRQAIAHAIDKEFIVGKLHHGLSVRLDGPLHHANPLYDAKALKLYRLDLDRANQLLDAAGHPRGRDGTRFQLTLDIPTFNTDSTQLVAEYLKPQLKKIGIDIVLRRSTDLADWANRVGNWNYQLTMDSSWNYPDPAIGVNRLFVCENIKKAIWTDTEGYCNERVDRLLTNGTTELDRQKRQDDYSQFQSIVTDELPFIWTNEEPYTTLYSPKLRNLPLGVWGALAPWDDMAWAA